MEEHNNAHNDTIQVHRELSVGPGSHPDWDWHSLGYQTHYQQHHHD
jgi:hypothetical protein